jgi:hypothetical protein
MSEITIKDNEVKVKGSLQIRDILRARALLDDKVEEIMVDLASEGKSIKEISEVTGLTYNGAQQKLKKLGVFVRKNNDKYSELKLANWRTGEVLKTTGLTNIVKVLKMGNRERIHLYPVVRGERSFHKDYCLPSELEKEYTVVTPQGTHVKFKNWLKFAADNGLKAIKFKRLLNEEDIWYKGFYLPKNKDKAPIILKRKISLMKDGKQVESTSVKKVAHELGEKESNIRNLINGKTRRNRKGVKIQKISYERRN